VNAIGPGAYRTLPPGEEWVADGWVSELTRSSVPKAGRYTAWVAYVFCNTDPGGLPLGHDEIRADVHRGIHLSNAVSLVVEEAPTTP
jgi:hypothetical protein